MKRNQLFVCEIKGKRTCLFEMTFVWKVANAICQFPYQIKVSVSFVLSSLFNENLIQNTILAIHM